MRVTVLSGAGISAESGVPTFRDDKNGLWARFDPYELSSTQGWRNNPERVWGWYLWRYYLVADVEPNAGHRAIADWQDHVDVSVITQNVDDLHERAGSTAVHHLHGSLFEFRCARCDMPYTDMLPEMPEPALEVQPPVCRRCGGLIRPDIVWFGEPLPEEPWQRAVEATEAADVMVVVGTSAVVYPAAGLPDLALSRGTVVIEVNPEPTPLTGSATLSLRETASQALPGLLQRLPALLELTARKR
jgi:NAD-dependent deacetylase